MKNTIFKKLLLFVAYAIATSWMNAQSTEEMNLDTISRDLHQREIFFMLDESNENDFVKYIKYVDVLFKKNYQNSEFEVYNKHFFQTSLNSNRDLFKITYRIDNDQDFEKWLEYEYKTTWCFFGDYKIESDWEKSTYMVNALNPPLWRKEILIESDPDRLRILS